MIAIIRLATQSVLVTTELVVALKGATDLVRSVALVTLPFVERLASWAEIRRRSSLVMSSGWGCKDLYDSMIKAVTTAENNPACTNTSVNETQVCKP